MQNRTYAELFDLIKSLAGVNEFTTEEDSYIRNFVNRRFRQAFDASDWWARYLIVGEARTATNGIIPTQEGSKTTIGEFLRIHRNKPFDRNSTLEYDFYVDFFGANIINQIGGTDQTGDVYVTYKRQFSPVLGFASQPNVQNVPMEFFYFIAHASYADFLRMDGQTEKAIVEEQIAEQHLDDSLGKASIIANTNTVGKKISTYVNRQSR